MMQLPVRPGGHGAIVRVEWLGGLREVLVCQGHAGQSERQPPSVKTPQLAFTMVKSSWKMRRPAQGGGTSSSAAAASSTAFMAAGLALLVSLLPQWPYGRGGAAPAARARGDARRWGLEGA